MAAHGFRYALLSCVGHGRFPNGRFPNRPYVRRPDTPHSTDEEGDVNAQPPTRVAVTGGAGCVGLNIVEVLLAAGHHIVVFDRDRQVLGFAPRYVIQTGIAAYVDSMRS
jgi:hypothetical protein